MKRIFFFILFVFMLVGCRSNNHQYHEVSTYEKAMQDSGIDFEAPEELASSILKDIRVYDEGMIEIIYLDLNHHETAVFQKAKKDSSLGGYSIQEEFEKKETIEIEKNKYTIQRNRNVVYTIEWEKDEYTYFVYLVKGKQINEIEKLVGEID